MADAFDYIESRDDADELIQEFGRAAQIVVIEQSGPAYEPILTTTFKDTFAVRVDFTWKQLQSGNVLTSDQRWLVAAGPLSAVGVDTITPVHKLRVGGADLPILKVDPLQPAETVVMHDCWIRF